MIISVFLIILPEPLLPQLKLADSSSLAARRANKNECGKQLAMKIILKSKFIEYEWEYHGLVIISYFTDSFFFPHRFILTQQILGVLGTWGTLLNHNRKYLWS